MKKEKITKVPAVADTIKTKSTVETPAKAVVSPARFVSFKMSAIIRTGEYQSVTPEIFVEGGTLDEAEALVTGHIDALMAKYNNCMVVKPVVRTVTPVVTVPVVKPVTVVPVAVATVPVTSDISKTEPVADMKKEQTAGAVSSSYDRATKAVESAVTKEALELLKTQVDNSKNLSVTERQVLGIKITAKLQALGK